MWLQPRHSGSWPTFLFISTMVVPIWEHQLMHTYLHLAFIIHIVWKMIQITSLGATFFVLILDTKERSDLETKESTKCFTDKINWEVPSLKLTAILHLKMDDWKTIVSLGWSIFRCYVSFRECIVSW